MCRKCIAEGIVFSLCETIAKKGQAALHTGTTLKIGCIREECDCCIFLPMSGLSRPCRYLSASYCYGIL